MPKAKTVKRFIDLQRKSIISDVGEVFDVTAERLTELVDKGFVVEFKERKAKEPEK